jgi:hypothetical protein
MKYKAVEVIARYRRSIKTSGVHLKKFMDK